MRNKRFFPAVFELLSSMRFAVSLLTLIAVASVIGTVLKQNEPYPNYQIEFGLFWFRVFERLGLYDVYHSSWFLLILAFLVVSTSVCIYRHFPGTIREMRRFRRQATSLRLLSHHAEFPVTAAFPRKLERYLQQAGYRFCRVEQQGAVLWTARKGRFQKLGYFLTHIGIVVIGLGGLIDGNLPLKCQEMLGMKTAETRDIPARAMPSSSRLAPTNRAFRANVIVPEGRAVDFAWVRSGQGALLQELPFTLQLKKFRVAYYSTGQPKLFASDVIVRDKLTGKQTEGTVQVNHPLIVDGIAIYQANFGDGGSALELDGWHLAPQQRALQPIQATSLTTTPLMLDGQPYQIEWGELRTLNIENVGTDSAPALAWQEKWQEAREVKRQRNLRNVGPSIQFKLRDQQGQAREYINYMWPFNDAGKYYLLSGVRQAVGEALHFVRLPLDSEMTPRTFMRLRATLLAKSNVDLIANSTADQVLVNDKVSTSQYAQFVAVTQRVLARFQQGGFNSLEALMDEAQVPQDKRSMLTQTYVKILQGAAIEAMQLAQKQMGKPALSMTADNYRFVVDSLIAINALFDYGAPVYLQLKHIQPVQASGFLLARAPGKTVVYTGFLLLISGIMAMFYIRDIRLWVRVRANQAVLAVSSNRKNQELDSVFAAHEQALRQLAQEEAADE